MAGVTMKKQICINKLKARPIGRSINYIPCNSYFLIKFKKIIIYSPTLTGMGQVAITLLELAVPMFKIIILYRSKAISLAPHYSEAYKVISRVPQGT